MGSDITCVPISFFDHPSIRGAAVVEYGSEGSGVLKDGGGGSCSESAGGFGGLVPQAVRDKAQMVNFSAQKRFTGTGSIQGLLVGCVDGAFFVPRGGNCLALVLGRLKAYLGQLGGVAVVLEEPGGQGRDGGGDQMGVDH